MDARIYISIEGFSFDATDFHARTNAAIGGRVARRAHNGAPLTNRPLSYWASDTVSVAPYEVGSKLLEVLALVLPHIETLPGRSSLHVCAQVVLEFDEGEEPVGLNFSREAIELLENIGAELDIDAVPRLTQRTLP